MKPTTLYLVRHGETVWNVENRMQGHLNSALTTKGLAQATLLADKIAQLELAACYTSDSPRAIKTAQLITSQLALRPQIDARLREIAMGTWEGQTHPVIQQADPLQWQLFWEQPQNFHPNQGGESFAALANRTAPAINQFLEAHSGEALLVVSHRLTIKTIINQLLGHSLSNLNQLADVEPNSLSQLEISHAHVKIRLYSDTSHYASLI